MLLSNLEFTPAELAQPVEVLETPPTPQQTQSGQGFLVWPQGEGWQVLTPGRQTAPAQLFAHTAAWPEVWDTVSRGGFVLLLEDEQPYGLLHTEALLQYLLRSRERLQAVVDTLLQVTDEAVTIIDEQSIVEGWNQNAQQLYKIKREDIVGKNIHDFFASLVVTKQLRDVLNEPEEVRDKYHQPVLGTHVMINAAPVIQNGRVIGAVAAEREITQTMRLSNELARSHSQVRDLQTEISKINRPNDAFSRIYGQSPALRAVVDMAKRIAHTDVSILLRGESGTGKELFAEAIHRQSNRADKPFVVINCGAIPANLFESELFGYLPGAFTGADKRGHRGKFEDANSGTIFLDEIGELSLDLQVKLLRVLQNQQFYRVGGGEPIEVDVRVISATHRDLEQMIDAGLFREDLYYRVNVVALEIPPLRERKEDISQLIYTFVREFCNKQGIPAKQIDSEVVNALVSYNWPGNIRELRNHAERMVALAEGPRITAQALPPVLRHVMLEREARAAELDGGDLASLTDKMERETILQALDKTLGDRSKAAQLLGIPRSTLYYKLKKHQIDMKYI